MDAQLHIDVTALDAAHRRALEDVIGQELQTNQRVTISVTQVDGANAHPSKQSLTDWAKVYEGLSEEQIEAIHHDVTTRADLTRPVP